MRRYIALTAFVAVAFAAPAFALPYVPVDASKTTIAFLDQASVKKSGKDFEADILGVSIDKPGGPASIFTNHIKVECQPLAIQRTHQTTYDATGKQLDSWPLQGTMETPAAKSISEAIAMMVCTGKSPNESVAGYSFGSMTQAIDIGKQFIGAQ